MPRTATATVAAVVLAASALAQAAPPSGGKVVIGTQQEPDILNPIITNMSASQECLQMLNGTPLDHDNQGRLVAELAEVVPSVENGGISKDGLTYRIKFKANAKWHDGAPVTSRDIKFTWKAIMEPKNQSTFRPGWDKVASIDDSDPRVAVIKLKEVYSPFILNLAHGSGMLLPAHVLSKSPDLVKDKWGREPTVMCGPFKFEKWVSGSYIQLVRNPDWVHGAPPLERIVYKVIPNENTLFTQLQTGEIDVWYNIQNLHQLPAVENIPNVTLYEFSLMGYEHLDFNLTHDVVKDRRVRAAIAHAINKDEISQTVYKGKYKPAWSVEPPLSWAFNPDVPRYAYDLDKSRALLDEAGWPLAGGKRSKMIDGKKIPMKILLTSTAGRPLRQQVESVVQQQLKQVGIEVEIRDHPGAVYFNSQEGTLTKGEFDMALYAWLNSSDPSGSDNIFMSTYLPPAGQNYTRYKSAEADRLLREATKTNDRKKRTELYRKFQRVVAEDLPTIPLLYWQGFLAASTRIQNVKPNPNPSVGQHWNVYEWYVQP